MSGRGVLRKWEGFAKGVGEVHRLSERDVLREWDGCAD